WINLEYLSAEPWVTDFHARASRHPTLPLRKHFFFPGFEPGTGGLLREHELIARRDAFRNSLQAQNEFRQKFGIPEHTDLKVSLFSYRHAPLVGLLQALANSPQRVLCLVPVSGILPAVGEYFGNIRLEAGAAAHHGNLTLLALPFLSQDEYDQLLWLCDINFVRGEDSWVRAIWAGKPFVWQPYHQEENTHLTKLEAFFDKYFDAYEASARNVIEQFHYAWIEGRLESPHWQRLLQFLPSLRTYTSKRSDVLAKMPDLASKLVILSENSQ